MRNSPVLLAAVAAIGAMYGCTLPLEGLFAEGTTSAGGATASASTTSATGGAASSTSTGILTCTTQDQCPSDVPCIIYACTMGECVASNVTDGMAVPDEGGNCKKAVCMGGAPKPQPDPADIVDDGDPCTSDVCDGNDEPRHDPGNDGKGCGSQGYHCFNGKCLQCTSPDQCPQGADSCQLATCFSGTCGLADEQDGVGCASSNECKNAGVCASGKCAQQAKSDGTPCAFGFAKCTNGCCGVKSCGGKCCLPGQHCSNQGGCTY